MQYDCITTNNITVVYPLIIRFHQKHRCNPTYCLLINFPNSKFSSQGQHFFCRSTFAIHAASGFLGICVNRWESPSLSSSPLEQSSIYNLAAVCKWLVSEVRTIDLTAESQSLGQRCNQSKGSCRSISFTRLGKFKISVQYKLRLFMQKIQSSLHAVFMHFC